MSKNWHYIITSKNRAKEELNPDGTKTVTIEHVTEINENSKLKFAPYSMEKGKTDIMFNSLLVITLIGLFIMAVTIIVGNDIMHLSGKIYNISSDFVAAAGLLMTILSFPAPRELISRFFYYGKVGNKLLISFYAFIFPFAIALILNYIGLSSTLSNLISIICVLVALINLK